MIAKTVYANYKKSKDDLETFCKNQKSFVRIQDYYSKKFYVFNDKSAICKIGVCIAVYADFDSKLMRHVMSLEPLCTEVFDISMHYDHKCLADYLHALKESVPRFTDSEVTTLWLAFGERMKVIDSKIMNKACSC